MKAKAISPAATSTVMARTRTIQVDTMSSEKQTPSQTITGASVATKNVSTKRREQMLGI
jgi:hypothetical protein